MMNYCHNQHTYLRLSCYSYVCIPNQYIKLEETPGTGFIFWRYFWT